MYPKISLPAKACGIAAAWISVAIFRFALDNAVLVLTEIGNSSNKDDSPTLRRKI